MGLSFLHVLFCPFIFSSSTSSLGPSLFLLFYSQSLCVKYHVISSFFQFLLCLSFFYLQILVIHSLLIYVSFLSSVLPFFFLPSFIHYLLSYPCRFFCLHFLVLIHVPPHLVSISFCSLYSPHSAIRHFHASLPLVSFPFSLMYSFSASQVPSFPPSLLLRSFPSALIFP